MGSSPRGSAHEDLFGAMERAAIDPKAWLNVCDGLAAVVGGAGTMFVPLRVQARTPGCPYSPRVEEPIQAYLSAWKDRDYRGDRGFPVILARGVAADQDFSTRNSFGPARSTTNCSRRLGSSGVWPSPFRSTMTSGLR